MFEINRILLKFLLCNIILVLFLAGNISFGQNDSLEKNKSVILKEYVTDETETLTKKQTETLRKKLAGFDDSTSTQIVVYMIRTLNGEPLENVSYSIAKENKIGTENNNGVLLLIVKGDRKIRIEVGYGLEGVLSDAKAGRIIDNCISPHFRRGDYYKGIDNGINEIIYAVHTEKFYSVRQHAYEKKSDKSKYSELIIAGVMVLMLLTGIFLFYFLVSGKSGSSGSAYRASSSGYKSSSTAHRSISTGSSGSSSGSRGFSGRGGSFGGGGASGSW